MILQPVYILIRTSGRPLFFARMMETIKNQTYKNIVTIVHTDDPRDEYVTGDLVIKGSAYGPNHGDGTYNLYNNRLLDSIPGQDGWYHFIDDDDEYASPDVIERFVKHAEIEAVNVARVKRWNDTIWPKHFGVQKTYQTECFLMSTKYKNKARWWGHKNGDHHYSKQLTKFLPINWIDNLIVCQAQEGKGHGKKLDKNGTVYNMENAMRHNKKVYTIGLIKHRIGHKKDWINPGEAKWIEYGKAYELEKNGIVKITYDGTREKAKPLQIYEF